MATSTFMKSLSPPTPAGGPPWLGPLLHRTQIDLQWLVVTGVMAAAGLVFFGIRGILCACCTALAAMVFYLLVTLLLKIIRPKHEQDSILHAIGVSLLLGLCMAPMRDFTVPIQAGLMLGIIMPLVGRSHRVRLHPVAIVLILMWLMPLALGERDLSLYRPPHGEIEAVLRPDHLVVGNLKDVAEPSGPASWWSQRNTNEMTATDAVRRFDPSALVLEERKSMLLHENWLVFKLQSGELCRLEELLLGAVPGMIGGSSRALLIVLGVYLMYRRLATWHVALAAVIAAVVTLMFMPLEIEHKITIVGMRLLWLPPRVAVTYVAYFILASPLAMIAMILAPITAPMTRRGQFLYGLTIGSTLIAAVWSFAAPQAAFLSLGIASFLSRPLDVMKRSPFVR